MLCPKSSAPISAGPVWPTTNSRHLAKCARALLAGLQAIIGEHLEASIRENGGQLEAQWWFWISQSLQYALDARVNISLRLC